MSYPAYEAFGRDIRVGFVRWRVYHVLQPPFLSHKYPRDLKVAVVRSLARISKRSTVAALEWLEASGYLDVHSRDARGTRSVTLAYDAPPAPPPTEAAAASAPTSPMGSPPAPVRRMA